MTTIKYSPLSSTADVSFFHALSQRKLHAYQLSEEAVPIWGTYTYGNRSNMPTRLSVSRNSFEESPEASKVGQTFVASGTLINTNTSDAFKAFDLNALTQPTADKLFEDFSSGQALADNSLITRFALLTYADLKKYIFHYWFAFPSLRVSASETQPPSPVTSLYSDAELRQVLKGFDALCADSVTTSCFLVRRIKEHDGNVEVLPLTRLPDVLQDDQIVVGFADPCSLPEHPGWPLRNLLALLSLQGAANKPAKVLCWRPRVENEQPDFSNCVVLSTVIPALDGNPGHVKGWEKDARGRLAPRTCNLSSTMDPYRLAEGSVDLNLQLMRWRLMPDVNLEKVKNTKCLLLGAGTLGCNVARCLLGWGVRHITFVDNAKISYSNPVRQTLFTFEDCKGGGRPKAKTAAERLKEIFPGVTTEGISMTIPMPGHPATAEHADERIDNEVAQLEQLIKSHDVVFLLMDTREARWLPTVMCSAFGKLCMTAAVGFDSFVVMRHGVPNSAGNMTAGCYFCNDATAPKDSTRDRTLDQQCTVSRPGLSMLTSSLVTELMVNVLHYPEEHATSHVDDEDACPLGLLPQQIRGHVSSFSTVLLSGQPFQQCTACSSTVREGFLSNRREFLINAFRESSYLEDLTGITELLRQAEESCLLETLTLSDADDDDEWEEISVTSGAAQTSSS